MNNKLWLCFPSNSAPKIYLSNNLPLRISLKLYQPYSKVGRLAKWLCSKSNAKRLLHLNNKTNIQGILEHLDSIIRAVLGGDDSLYVSFSMGTAGPHQKITAQVADINAKVICYVKISQSSAISHLLLNEKNALERIYNELNTVQILIPKVLAFKNIDNYQMLFVSALNNACRSKPLFGDLNVLFIDELHNRGITELHIDSWLDEITEQLKTNNQLSLFNIDIISNSIEALRKVFTDGKYQACYSHGDYTPWNTFTQKPNSTYVFDWEYFSLSRPLFYDLYHYVYMVEKLVNKATPKATVKMLSSMWLNTATNNIFRKKCISYDEFCAYMLFYFIDQLARPSIDAKQHIKYLTGCISILIDILEKNKRKHRVLLSAYACEYDTGSEPGVGWNWLHQISSDHEVTVITKDNNRESIQRGILENPQLSINPIYVSVPKWLSFWKKQQRGIRTYYYLWQFFAYLKARKLHSENEFDIGHHVTFVNDWLWTFFALLDIPYVWGPIGSHPKPPKILLKRLDYRAKEAIRLVIQHTMRLLDPLFWLSAFRADLVLGINHNVKQSFPLSILVKNKFLVEPAIGIENVPNAKRRFNNNNVVRILFVGRFVPLKNPILALEAFAEYFRNGAINNIELIMVGSGSEKARLLKKVKDYGLFDNVKFIPWVSRQEVIKLMSEADIFLFPSIEGGGMVVLEAMVSGMPVICLNYGGPGEMVSNDAGISIPIGSYAETVQALKDALAMLVDTKTRERMSLAAVANAKSRYMWVNKKKFIGSVYNCILTACIK